MTTIIFVTPQGERMPCSAAPGQSAMYMALTNGIDGIVAECGGSLVCGTCHVYVDETRINLLDAPGPMEDEMLDITAAPRRPNSRLACQIRVTEALDGLVLHLPDRQV